MAHVIWSNRENRDKVIGQMKNQHREKCNKDRNIQKE